VNGRCGTDRGWVEDLVRRLHGMAERFGLAAVDTRYVGAALERCWSDDCGRAWTDRAGLVQRQLDRDATACTALADRVARAAQDQWGALTTEDGTGAGSAPGGPLLGSTAARRADAARGMRIAMLSDEGPAPSGGR